MSVQPITPLFPNWYLNVVSNPEVRVQIRAEKFAVRARTALGEERTRLWRLMTSLAPVYHEYEARCRRYRHAFIWAAITRADETGGGYVGQFGRHLARAASGPRDRSG